MSAKIKLAGVGKVLKGYGSVLVAFSGGVDSTFLLKAASMFLPADKILAVTANSLTYSKEELNFSKRIARSLGVRHKVIRTSEIKDRNFSANSTQRCYYCKKELFSRLNKIAAGSGLNVVADASNISDRNDYRPGTKAKNELGVRSPLQEAGLSKDDIRRLSKKMGLPTWDKPSLACLASRVPYGTKITPADLRQINKAEQFIRSLGYKQVRVRHHGELARIEVEKADTRKLVTYHAPRITRHLRKLGYKYITIDLEGYRTGSLNEVIK
jgi:pyridinium-3,5-biscarboxylic acid mononucleotide sulfurtransferase